MYCYCTAGVVLLILASFTDFCEKFTGRYDKDIIFAANSTYILKQGQNKYDALCR